MCNDKLDKYQIKLNAELNDYNVPKFLRKFFVSKPKVTSSQTYCQYWNVLKNFLLYLIENQVIDSKTIESVKEEDIQSLKVNDINRYLIYCKNVLNNLDDTTKTKFNTLCSLWSYLVGEEIIDINKNIMTRVDVIKTKRKPIKYATLQDKNELITNLSKMKCDYDKIRNIAIVELLMGSGVRLSELVNLDMEDLHLNEENKKPYIFVRRKGGDTDNVAISLAAKISLEEYLIIRPERVNENNANIVFLSEKTDPELNCQGRMTDKAIYNMIKKYSNQKLNPHMFRKGLCMLIVNNPNGSFSAASQQLGHYNETTTRRWYGSINMDNMSDLLDSL